MMIPDLSRMQVLKLVERQNLNEVMKEQSLALSGPLVTISARIVDTESGETAGAGGRYSAVNRIQKCC